MSSDVFMVAASGWRPPGCWWPDSELIARAPAFPLTFSRPSYLTRPLSSTLAGSLISARGWGAWWGASAYRPHTQFFALEQNRHCALVRWAAFYWLAGLLAGWLACWPGSARLKELPLAFAVRLVDLANENDDARLWLDARLTFASSPGFTLACTVCRTGAQATCFVKRRRRPD